MSNWILAYVDAIRHGDCIVPKRVRKVYEALADEIEHPRVGYAFDVSKANKPIDFIERFCRHSKGEWAGRPVKLELFQKAFISALYGFVDASTGLRRYREGLLLVGRKNGKSTMLAGLALYMLIGDREPGAEVYSVATKKDQARIIFDEVLNTVKQSPELSAHVRKRKVDLYFDAGMSKMMPLGRNADTLDGLNAHLVVIDELHGIKDRNLYEVMKQSQSARRQPLLIMITTAGTIRECIYDDMYRYAASVADGSLNDPCFLPVLYELDSKDEWKDPAMWVKANPGLGVIKKVDDLAAKVARAQNNPNDLAGVLCKDFNQVQTVSTSWLTFDDIQNTATFDMERFRGSYAIGGADLAITTDLACATLLMMDGQGVKYVAQMYWLPYESFDKRVHTEKIPYDKWYAAGLLRLCHGYVINYSDITAWFVEMAEKYELNVPWIYYDSYAARYWVQEMEANGFRMVRCIQGAKTLSVPMQMLGADLQAKQVNYGNNPLLKWCISNTAIQTDRNGNIVPVKAQNAKYRIDGLASLLDAYVGLCEHFNEFKDVTEDV